MSPLPECPRWEPPPRPAPAPAPRPALCLAAALHLPQGSARAAMPRSLRAATKGTANSHAPAGTRRADWVGWLIGVFSGLHFNSKIPPPPDKHVQLEAAAPAFSQRGSLTFQAEHPAAAGCPGAEAGPAPARGAAEPGAALRDPGHGPPTRRGPGRSADTSPAAHLLSRPRYNATHKAECRSAPGRPGWHGCGSSVGIFHHCEFN